MNLEKIHSSISKAVFNLKNHTLGVSADATHVFIGDKHQVYRINRDDFLFSTTTLLIKGVKEYAVYKRIFESTPVTPAIKTGNLRDGVKPNYPFIELKAGDELIYIDTQYLKNFDKGCTFTGTKYNTPVYVWENGECVGMVLPVIVKK